MDLTDFWNNPCQYDIVILDNFSGHCGQINKPWSYISSSNSINIILSIQSSFAQKGFLAIWTATSEPPSYPPSGTTSCGSCRFPFEFDNMIYDTCTSIDGDQPWCLGGPPVDEGTHILPPLKYYCSDSDSSCPGTLPQMSVHPNNEPGNCCKFLWYWIELEN